MHLLIDWPVLEAKLKKSKDKAKQLQEDSRILQDKMELLECKRQYDLLKKELIEFLANSFSVDNQDLAHEVRSINSNKYDLGIEPDFSRARAELTSDIQELVSYLEYNTKSLSEFDLITDPNSINLDERASFTIDEKLDFLIEKLYDLNRKLPDHWFSISEIFKYNGVQLGGSSEEGGLADSLENYDYIKKQSAKYISVKITIEGRRYVENNIKRKPTDYSRINQSDEELRKKIDDIIEHLRLNNLGQQILYEELQELKKPIDYLDRKNWGQLLKGKLFDLGISKATDNAVLATIFKELTSQTFLT